MPFSEPISMQFLCVGIAPGSLFNALMDPHCH